MGISSENGQPLNRKEYMRQAMSDVLFTRIGTRPVSRDYGSRIPDMIDDSTNRTTVLRMVAEVNRALSLWVPQVQLQNVSVLNEGKGRVVFLIDAEVVATGRTEQFRVTE